MKQLFQIAGVLLIVLLGAGPASAAVGCAAQNSAMDSSCPMGMAGMGADCPMSHSLAALDCSEDCCNLTAPVAQVVNAVPVKPKLIAAAQPMLARTVATEVEGISRPGLSKSVAANSPPRYILLRVFRI